ncbi:hypothetical protein [Rubrivivax sp. JA1026]|uniref:hypothetical protein n=1 Tax=Rubrivivax sp. JA1026 TaxID=2710888 RepID=UPI0013E94083|nr:hypothetical protein [Rubrivivax sp. JA1026]
MDTTLTYLSTSVTFTGDVSWQDEYAYQPVEAELSYSITGRPVVEAVRKTGRPMTLVTNIWLTHEQLSQLMALSRVPAARMTLDYRGEQHTVLFMPKVVPVEAVPAYGYSDDPEADYFDVTLRFLKVE